MSWKKFIRAYFTFNNRELRGVLILVGLLVVLLAVRVYIALMPSEEIRILRHDASFLEHVSSENTQTVEKGIKAESVNTAETETSSFHWVEFDPNTASVAFLISSGLPDHIAQRLVNYREKVKPFEYPADVLKVYDLDSSWYHDARTYINIEQEPEQTYDSQPVFEPEREAIPEKSLVELNKADTNQLKSIPGVGSYFARKIVELRESFGGFYEYEQLEDIYYMSEETMTKIVSNSTIDTNQIVGLELNNVNERELTAHPYLSWKQAQAIMNYRKQHGPYDKKKDILKTKVIPDSVYVKLAPYLEVR